MAKSIGEFMTEGAEDDEQESPLASFMEKSLQPKDTGTTLSAASDVNADQYAESYKYGKEHNIPTDIVDADIGSIRTMDRVKKSEKTLAWNKSLSEFISNNMDHAIVAQDDIEQVDQYTKLYGAGREFQDPSWASALGGGYASPLMSIPAGVSADIMGKAETLEQMRLDIGSVVGTTVADSIMRAMPAITMPLIGQKLAPDFLPMVKSYFEGVSQELAPEFEGSFSENPSLKRGVSAVAGAVASITAAIAVGAATKNPVLGTSMLVSSETGPMFEEFTDAGESVYKAAAVTNAVGGIVYMLEKYGLDEILKPATGVGAKTLVRNFVQSGSSEALTEITQTVIQNAAAIFGYGADKDFFEGGWESVIGGFFGGGGVNTALNFVGEKAKVDQAEANQEFVEKLAAGGDIDSKTLKRSPELFQSVLQAVVEKDGGLTELRIPMKDLNAYFEQVGMDKLQEILETSPELKKQYDEAVQIAADTGVEIESDLIIPTGVFAARFAPEHGPALARDIRVGAGGMTFNESQQAKKAFPDEIEKVRAEMEQDKAAVEANRTVYDEAVEAFTQQNIASGRYARESESRYNAIAMAKGMVGMAVRAGKDPAEVWKKYNPQIKALSDEEFLARQEGRVDEDGITFDQQGQVVQNEAFQKWFGESQVVDESGQPLVVYHGTNGADISSFDTGSSELGAHFGNIAQAEAFSKNIGGVQYPVFLNIKNPLRLTDVGNFEPGAIAGQLADLGIISEEQSLSYIGVGNETDAVAELQQAIEAAGYDGIVYLNRREGLKEGRFGEKGEEDFSLEGWREFTDEMDDVSFLDAMPEAADSYITFSPTQIKSVNNRGTFDAADPNILNQVGMTEQATALAEQLDGVVIVEDMAIAQQTFYSTRTWTDVEKQQIRELAEEMGIEESAVDQWMFDIDSAAAIVLADPTLDFDAAAADLYSALKPNSDPHYKVSLDFSTLCRKRYELMATIEAIQLRRNEALTKELWVEIREKLDNLGYDVSCGACYVDAKRMEAGKFVNEFIADNPEEDPQQFLSQANIDKMAREKPELYKAFKKKLGSNNAKTPETRTDYNGEIRDYFVTSSAGKARTKAMNTKSGLRWQSWSDFEVQHLMDAMQAVLDMHLAGLMGHGYTKVPDFVLAMGNTGLMINMSLIAKGTGLADDGTLIFDSKEGMDFDVALELRDAHEMTAGTIAVGISNEHIKALLADPRIDYVIPYHASGLAKDIAKKFNMDAWEDFTATQTEDVLDYDVFHAYMLEQTKPAKGKKMTPAVKKFRAKMVKLFNAGEKDLYRKAAKASGLVAVDTVDFWDDTVSGEENTARYLAVAAERGLAPKFRGKEYATGRVLEDMTGEPGYWKLLIDRKVYDHNGNNIVQKPVSPEYDNDAIQDIYDRASQNPIPQAAVEEVAEEYYQTENVVDNGVGGDGRVGPTGGQDENTGEQQADGERSESIESFRQATEAVEGSDVRSDQEKSLLAWAEANDMIIDDAPFMEEWESSGKIKGQEHQVIVDAELGTVIKRKTLDPTESWSEYFDQMEVHNTLFPSAAYTLHGFTQGTDAKGKQSLMAVVSQTFVVGENTKTDTIKDFMTEAGFTFVPVGKAAEFGLDRGKWSKHVLPRFVDEVNGIVVYDLHEKNVLTDADGNLVFIDPMIEVIPSLATKEAEPGSVFNQADQKPASGKRVPRASINFAEEGITPINLYDGMNLTSLLHETGHFYLQMLSDFASEPDANEDITKDWDVIKSWLGVGPDGKITRAQHEMFADGFLNYLMENEAPSPELRTAFARFRQWLSTLKDSFQTIVLSKEVKDVFSRILATDEEITRAEQQAGYDQMFKSAEEAGMTEAEWADYTGRVAKARLQAEEILKKELMAEMKREQTSIWKAAKAKVREEVEALVNAMPVYNVGSVLRRNKYADGTEVDDDMKDLRLDGESMTDEQKKKLVGIWVKTGGTNIDGLADMFGFASGDEMMNAMIDAPPKKEAIDKQVDQRMAAEFGDLMMDDQARAEEADKAIHSDKRGDLLNTEIRKLGNLAKRKPSAVQAVKAAAQRIIASKKVRDLRPDHYQREESKAARAALKAAAKGDWETAFTEKQKQIMNHHLYREARKAKDLADKSAKRMVKLGKEAGQKRIAKAGGDFLEQVNHILERFEFKPVSLKALDKRQTLLEFITKMEEQDEDVFIDEKLINEAYAVNYKDLTVSEMQGVVDTVDHLLHLVKTKNRLLDNKDKRDIEDIAVDLAAQVKISQGLGKEQPIDPNTITTFQTLTKWGRAIDASLIRMEQVVDWLDGGNPDGPWARFLWNAFPNAQNKENDMMEETMKGVAENFKEYGSRKDMDKRYTINSLPDDQSRTKTWILSVALNVGNDSNYSKLMHGYGWNEDQLSEILSHMTEKDWQFVQSMWNQIDELWPKITALEKEVRGLPPEKIEPRPVMTPYGTFAGGYYPVVYDKTKSQAGKKQQGAENQALFDGATQKATTPRGHLNSRIESFSAPIKLGDLSVIPNHLSAVIHDLSHRTAIRNAEKIMSQQIVRDSITETLGHEYVEMIDLWIQSVANDRVLRGRDGLGVWSNFMGKIRINATIVSMGFKATTLMSQFAGFTNSMEHVSNLLLAKNIAKLTASPRQTTDYVFAKSAEMKHRIQNRDRDIKDALRGLTGRTDPLAHIQEFAFLGIGYADLYVAIPTWMAKYEEMIAAGKSEKVSVAAADRAVRLSQGAGGMKDLPAVMRGQNDLMKLSTMFYSYFSVLYSRLRDMGKKMGSEDTWRRTIARSFYIIILPAIMGELLANRGPDDWDDEEEVMPWLAKTIAIYPTATVPVLRDVANASMSKIEGKGFFGYKMSPAAGAMAKIAEFPPSVVSGIAGEKDWDAVAFDAFEASGYLFGLPTGQAKITGGYVYDIINGDEVPEDMGEFIQNMAYRRTD